jgi:hypothetical protein
MTHGKRLLPFSLKALAKELSDEIASALRASQ